MMFGWYEMDLALGRVRYMPPLQGLGFLWGLLPRALPWAITLCPVGAEDRCPVGAEDRCPVGAEDRCPVGAEDRCGVGGLRLVRRWGGRPVPLLGAEDRCVVGGGRPVRRWGRRPVLLWGRRPLPRWGRLMLSVRRTIILRGRAARLICVCFIAGIPFGVLRFAVSRRYRRSESFFDVFWSFGVDRKRISSDRIGFNNPR